MSTAPWSLRRSPARDRSSTGRPDGYSRKTSESALGPPTHRGPSSFSLRARGFGERGDDLPDAQTPLAQPKKRTLGAKERDEFVRLLWREELGGLDPSGLVFVDEMGTHTSLAPIYAYSPVGERAYFEVPRNRGKNTTLIASLHAEGMGPSMAVEGGTTSRV